MEAFKKIRLTRIKGNASEERNDTVATEKRLRILVNGNHVISLYCTPLMVRELVVGIVHNEGLISGEWCADRISIEYGNEIRADIPAAGTVNTGELTITSGCAGGISLTKPVPDRKLADGTVFAAETITRMFREFQQKSDMFRLTGGVHSAALSDGEKILAFAEDIGRHNAVDKVIGFFLLEQISFQGKILLASGRLSSDILQKSIRCGIPVVVSRAAPTSLAVETAEAAGITLIGFLRGDRMNAYTTSDRIHL